MGLEGYKREDTVPRVRLVSRISINIRAAWKTNIYVCAYKQVPRVAYRTSHSAKIKWRVARSKDHVAHGGGFVNNSKTPTYINTADMPISPRTKKFHSP